MDAKLLENLPEQLPLYIIDFADLVTPTRQYTGAAVFWNETTLVGNYLPGAIAYTIKSIPDLLENARQATVTKWENDDRWHTWYVPCLVSWPEESSSNISRPKSSDCKCLFV